LEFFTDPFLLVGEGAFSWRHAGVALTALNNYEQDAGRLIAAFRTLGAQLGHQPPLLRRSLGLTKVSSFEDAAAAGERFAAEFDLGEAPARRLAEVMEQKFGILVLMVDAIPDVSGAACRLPEFDAVLINRHEVPGRRHYDLAHELFHLLTWTTMPPERVEDTQSKVRGRVEQLADNFAGALLMPTTALDRLGDWVGLESNALATKLNDVAEELGVTSVALKWRLVAAGRLAKAAAQAVDDARLRHNGRSAAQRETPPLFSKPFAELLAQALDQGQLSARRAASLLGLAVDDLEAVFGAHGVDIEIGL
jgi:Zn-dependent peptidase ImmA (M78 family)